MLFRKIFPKKNIYIKNKEVNKPWISEELGEYIKERHRLYKKYIKKPITFGKQYRKYRNKVNNMLETAKRNYYMSKLNMAAGNGKETWKVIREIVKGKCNQASNIEQINVNGQKVTDPNVICNQFNSYFSSVGQKLASEIPASDSSPLQYLIGNYPDMELSDTSPQEILSIIKDLKDSGPGHDEIHIKVIKQAAIILAPVISRLINLSFGLGKFPEKLKIAKIISIYKGGKDEEVNNYRPISILSSINKIFERAMYDRVIKFLKENAILTDKQFGFRKNRSPHSAILSMINQILHALDNKFYTIGIFLDLRKAFDTIDHSILLSKLRHYGIRNKAYNWFKSYLTNRQQYTVVNDSCSDFAEVSTGVPQGSTLGPLLFLIYINDIVRSSNILEFTLFADDTSIILSGPNLVNLTTIINSELKYVSTWLSANKLSLNISKTHYMVFAGSRGTDENLSIKICDNNIERCYSTKYLGIIIDCKLTWKEHVKYIHGKLSKSCGIMYKIKHILDRKTRLTLYYSLFYPYIQYCIVVWGMAAKSILTPLIIIQKRIVRIISDVNYNEHTDPLFKNLGVLKLNDVYLLESLKYVHCQLNSQQTITFLRSSDVHNVNTRYNNQLRPPLPRTELSKRFISYSGCIKWNNLPIDIQIVRSNTTFKIKAKKFIVNKY